MFDGNCLLYINVPHKSFYLVFTQYRLLLIFSSSSFLSSRQNLVVRLKFKLYLYVVPVCTCEGAAGDENAVPAPDLGAQTGVAVAGLRQLHATTPHFTTSCCHSPSKHYIDRGGLVLGIARSKTKFYNLKCIASRQKYTA